MRDPDMTTKLLVELSQGEDTPGGNEIGILDIQAHMIDAGQHQKIRDEIAGLAPGNGFKEIQYIHMDADSLIAQVRGANEETVRRFENVGWSWDAESSGEGPA